MTKEQVSAHIKAELALMTKGQGSIMGIETHHGHSISFITIIDNRRYVQNSFPPRTIDQSNCLTDSIVETPFYIKEGVCGLAH